MMKNFLLSTLLIFLLGNLCHFGLPWWGIVPIAFVVAWALPQAGWSAFSSGLLAGMLLWGVSAVLLNTANGGMFSAKIGQIFQGLRSTSAIVCHSPAGRTIGRFRGINRAVGQRSSHEAKSAGPLCPPKKIRKISVNTLNYELS